MQRSSVPVVLGIVLLLAGCAATRVDTTGVAPGTSWCQPPGAQVTAIVLWGPQWRADQKDVPLREDAARRGLDDFVMHSGCFARVDVRRLAGGGTAVIPSADEMRTLAASAVPGADRVVVVVVRELGPVLRLQTSAVLVEGSTEVVLDITVLDVRAEAPPVGFRTHWQNGGAYVVKGVGTLPQDMRSALASALLPTGPSRE